MGKKGEIWVIIVVLRGVYQYMRVGIRKWGEGVESLPHVPTLLDFKQKLFDLNNSKCFNIIWKSLCDSQMFILIKSCPNLPAINYDKYCRCSDRGSSELSTLNNVHLSHHAIYKETFNL